MIPVLLFRSMIGDGTAPNMEPSIVFAYFGGCLIILILALICGRILFRLRLDQLGVFGMAAMYSNAVLLGLPLMQTASDQTASSFKPGSSPSTPSSCFPSRRC